MKKILFISAFPPSPYSAGQNFTLNLLNDLAKEHSVDLVYFDYHGQSYASSNERIRVIKQVPLTTARRLLNFLLCPFFHPLFSTRFSLPVLFFLRRMVRTNGYDMICFDFSQVFLYSLFFKGQRKVLIAHDVIAQKFSRQGFAPEKPWIAWTERRVFRQPDVQAFTFSEKDKTWILGYTPRIPVTVVNFYLSPYILKQETFPVDNYFCFFAAWNRPENHEGLTWFLDEVLPLVADTQFLIIGAKMPDRLVKRIANVKNIRYSGFVENPYPLISRARALVAPLFKGAGVKVKVIESLACGTPVIGTKVALEGITEITPGSMKESNTAEEFIREIVNFTSTAAEKIHLRNEFLKAYSDEKKRIKL